MAENRCHTLLSKDVIETAIKNHLGPEWQLSEYNIEDFGKKGDNFVTVATGIKCLCVKGCMKQEVHYIAKLNTMHPFTAHGEFLNEHFIKECGIFLEIAPQINIILQRFKVELVKFPEIVYHSLENNRETMITKDLRQEGYNMISKVVEFNYEHAELFLKSLARFHAASKVLTKDCSIENVYSKYPYLYDACMEPGKDGLNLLEMLIKNNLDVPLSLISHMKEYEKQYKWIKDMKDKGIKLYEKLVKDCDKRMRVINHGDCWKNNLLFKNDTDGRPSGVALLDLQLTRLNSIGNDINYFFYMSLTGEQREKYYDKLLLVYFEEFSYVMKAAKMEMPFTRAEFEQEVFDRAIYGLLNALTFMPLLLCEPQNALSYGESEKGEFKKNLKKFYDSIMKQCERNTGLFISKYACLFDDLIKKKIIK